MFFLDRVILMRIVYFVFVTLLVSCNGNDSKWEKIKGTGIDNESKSLDPIYFQNADKGVVGGYMLTKKNGQANSMGLEPIPLLYITEDGGRIWNQIDLGSNPRGRITNVYLNADTLICTKEDSTVLFSTDRGQLTTSKMITSTKKLKTNILTLTDIRLRTMTLNSTMFNILLKRFIRIICRL